MSASAISNAQVSNLAANPTAEKLTRINVNTAINNFFIEIPPCNVVKYSPPQLGTPASNAGTAVKDCFQTAAVIKQLHGFAFITEPAVYRTQTENTVAYARTGSIMLFLSPAQLVFRASTPDCKCLAGGESERPLARKALPS